MEKINNILKNKKFKYGSLSVVFTAVVLALIVVINATFTLLASGFHWYIDMTEEQLYTVSDTSKELIDEMQFDGSLTILFLQEKDKIEDSSQDYTGDAYLKQIHELALDYKAKFDFIKLEYVNIYTNPERVEKYGTALQPTSIVFENGESFKVLTYSSFLAYDSSSSSKDPIGFYGEHKITATILALCSEKKIAYLTEGHGEDPISESFKTILESCGYECESVNLSTITLEKLMEDRPRLVIVINPKTDFIGIEDGKRNETEWVQKIIDGSYDQSGNPVRGSLLVFGEPGYSLSNLNKLTTLWGMQMNTAAEDMVSVTDRDSIGSNADLTRFMPLYHTTSTDLAYNLVSKLSSYDNYKVAIDGSGTVSVSDISDRSDIAASSVLDLPDSATNNNEKYLAAGMPVMAIAQNRYAVDGTIFKYNYVMLCADSSIISDKYLLTSSYANEALMTAIIRATANESESTPKTVLIEYKDYITETNVTGVSNSGKKAFLVVMAAIIPAAILTVGTVVYVRRKNR